MSFSRLLAAPHIAWRTVSCLFVSFFFSSALSAAPFDHEHSAFTQVLNAHVSWRADAGATLVDYAALKSKRAGLDSYLSSLSNVTQAQFESFSVLQRRAFLINAYNGYTLQLILSRYPDLKSIKDLGSLLSSPWKKPFAPLLGKIRSLDQIEHELLRGATDFNEPRIHFAVNCASIGCPALRPEAFTATKLDQQLLDQTQRFLSDRSRNHFDPANDALVISKIFDWYAQDFEKGYLGANSVSQFLAGKVWGSAPHKRLPLSEMRSSWIIPTTIGSSTENSR
jgi:hypothetical protein